MKKVELDSFKKNKLSQIRYKVKYQNCYYNFGFKLKYK